MGKFDGMLLVSDFDNTLIDTSRAMETGVLDTALSPRNVEGIWYWMEHGGTFAVATGRAMVSFRRFFEMIPTNAPAIVDNGGAIYDFRRNEYLVSNFLPPEIIGHLRAVMERFPEISLELYHDSPLMHVVHPIPRTFSRSRLAGIDFEIIEEINEDTVPLPLMKAMLMCEREVLDQAYAFAGEEGWRDQYEMTFSAQRLLEITRRGANKGTMARKLMGMCGCTQLFCVGDQINDMPMLSIADQAFAPANAAQEVLSSGVTMVCHCRDGAIGDIVERLS